MKTTLLTILSLLNLVSCNVQEQQANHKKSNQVHYQVIGESSISFGGHNSILNYSATNDKKYLIYVSSDQQDKNIKHEYFFLKLSSKGDSINSFPVYIENFLGNYIELDSFYFAITTDIRTMGGYTKDFLTKYDKNWKLIWSRKIDKPKNPDGSTVLTLTKNNEILLIANEFIPHTTKIGISFRRYNLDGRLLSEKLMLTKNPSNPISIIQTADNNYYLTADQYDQEKIINSLWLMKLTEKGDTIWTKKYPHFYPRKTVLTSSGNLLFYGINYSQKKETNAFNEYLKIMCLDKEGNLKWQKDINQNYYEEPGNIIETKNGSYLFSSAVETIKDEGYRAYLFELNKNGELLFEKKFEYPVGIGNVPFLIRSEGQITMIGQKWIGKFDDAFHDIIQITKLTD